MGILPLPTHLQKHIVKSKRVKNMNTAELFLWILDNLNYWLVKI